MGLFDAISNFDASKLSHTITKYSKGAIDVVEELDDLVDEKVNAAKIKFNEAKDYLADHSDDIAKAIDDFGGDVANISSKAYSHLKEIFHKVMEYITLPFLRSRAKMDVPKGVKMQIIEAKKNAVKVGIFDEYDNCIERVRYESIAGIDASIKAGTQKYSIGLW